MPPSASATPPTQTTQRVPKLSSKPIDRGGAGTALGAGELGTDVAAACDEGDGGADVVDGAGNGGSGSVTIRTGGAAGAAGCGGAASAGAGRSCGEAAADGAGPSSSAILDSRRRN